MYYTIFDTWLCEIILAGSEEGLHHLHLNTGEGTGRLVIEDDWVCSEAFFTNTIEQVNEYFAGTRREFDIKIAPVGTAFQRRVWMTLCSIPFGKTASYRDVAHALGNPGAARAVGSANGKNPLPLIIPCHRVIAANGGLAGFASGLRVKEALLRHEQRIIDKHS